MKRNVTTVLFTLFTLFGLGLENNASAVPRWGDTPGGRFIERRDQLGSNYIAERWRIKSTIANPHDRAAALSNLSASYQSQKQQLQTQYHQEKQADSQAYFQNKADARAAHQEKVEARKAGSTFGKRYHSKGLLEYLFGF